ncbi:hypothetical protein CAOG_06490 [Capsaspora owczarzaki ATCC 30864]|uniref:hypothetical protein n=1 Tax=Capsaspora owczarzaki (strain ATCC 30864) TaxID=595528 RepID=UPI0001FE3801|nr:hypothetical protein CAOG_06490 [Capsaspora owczarzaki ATCC 30864]|eukprot:XP_004345239.1 hypothetical protein CAOG_06490 [Capsaspora owczarzaki ATCC 30864]
MADHSPAAASSSSSSAAAAWGELEPINANTSAITLSKATVVIGRSDECDAIITNTKKLSGKHCTLMLKDSSAFIVDTSTNGVLVNGSRIVKGEETKLNAGDSIVIVKDPVEDNQFGYYFKDLLAPPPLPAAQTQVDENEEAAAIPSKRRAEDADDEAAEAKTNKKPRTDDMEQNLQCGICMEILHDCVSVVPCLHDFCGACYSDWMEKKSDCPTCRAKVTSISRNHRIKNLCESFLAEHPEKRRPDDEIAEMNARNKITSDMLKPPRRRYDDDEDEDDYDDDEDEDDGSNAGPGYGSSNFPFQPFGFQTICRQCPNAPNPVPGYTCPPGGGHGRCTCCHQFMPLFATNNFNPHAPQADPNKPQSCEICKRQYCHMYWGCTCNGGCLSKLRNFQFDQAALATVVNRNTTESDLLRDYLTSKSLTINDMYKDCITNLDSKKFKLEAPNKDIYPQPLVFGGQPAIPTGDTVLCRTCVVPFLGQLAYQYREAIPNSDLPSRPHRPKCYWGSNCKTQVNTPHHASKFDHICKQTRFS